MIFGARVWHGHQHEKPGDARSTGHIQGASTRTVVVRVRYPSTPLILTVDGRAAVYFP